MNKKTPPPRNISEEELWVGKLPTSRRYNQLPLLRSSPGGFARSWPYRTYPYFCIKIYQINRDTSHVLRCKDSNYFLFYKLISINISLTKYHLTKIYTLNIQQKNNFIYLYTIIKQAQIINKKIESMKKFLLSLLCLVAIVANAQTGNLLSNSSFEEWSDNLPTGWATLKVSNATVEQSNDAHSGSSSVVIKGASGNKRFASHSYTLEAGTYTISGYFKANGEEAGYYRLGYVKLKDGVVVDSQKDYIYDDTPAQAATNEWKEETFTFTLDTITEIAVNIMNNKNGKGASFLVDDVTLIAGESEGGEDGGEEPEQPTEVSTIAEVLAAGAGNAAVKGTVIATYARGFLVNDSTGTILVYLGSDKGHTEGDVVTVSGKTSLYGGLLQFGDNPTVEKNGTASVSHPTPATMTGAQLDEYLTAPTIKYVEYTGTLTINGNYYNIAVEGATTAIASIQYPKEGIVNATSGAVVKVTGYTIGASSGKYVNTMAIKVEAGGETQPDEPIVGSVNDALAAYVDGKKIQATVTGYIVGAVNGDVETGSEFGSTEVATNILIADDADESDYTKCLIVQLPKGDIRKALNLADNANNYKKQIKISGSLETYFKVAGLKSITEYEFTGVTGIDNVNNNDAVEKVIYDLTGRKVDTITKAGIYIVNGKKVLIK